MENNEPKQLTRCSLHESELNRIRSDVGDIKRALLGDARWSDKGWIAKFDERLRALEIVVDSLVATKSKVLVIGSALVIIGGVLSKLIGWIIQLVKVSPLIALGALVPILFWSVIWFVFYS